ncbi:small ribosomal subunit protein uS9m [Anopheles ziemanni]|uniref:small ribosomal subunit protein uS9m n=1 Tax=Anopheles coustani TaxID=139045 RepID=UPI00265B54D8|nr:small ribosomal subunit protein uS9m [Anopheles coustani]XP_058167689.1 small ribosomal subunit protein uS9m [Anopheles ziemanni]
MFSTLFRGIGVRYRLAEHTTVLAARFLCTPAYKAEDGSVVQKAKISKAMKAYLERAREYESSMEQARSEYQLGKRHLANMMGADVETFTQQDIDQAIQYLFPSGLYDPAARPSMKPPEEFMPKKKGAEFDETGRPFHSLFYTGRPNFFQLLYDIVENISKLNALEDGTRIKGKSLDSVGNKLDVTGSEWLPKELLEKKIVETITDIEYDNFVNAMNRLVDHPLSERSKEFIKEYRKPLISKMENDTIPAPQHDADGRQYVTIYECLRKTARGDVTMKFPGTGSVLVNGKDLRTVGKTQQREQILFPLLFTNMVGKVDVLANVSGGGPSSQAGAVRWGIAMALRSFVDAELISRMRIAGLLTRDYRRRERKKPGQAGARRKYTWKKR